MVKEGIHPQYEKVTIKCACGAEFETSSTKKDIRFLPVSRSWLTPAVALIDLKSALVLMNNNYLKSATVG